MGEDALANDDRVVHDDPQYEDEPEQGHLVHRDVEARHQHDGPEKRDRDTKTDPERQPELEKQGQHEKHECKPGGPVSEQQRQLSLEPPRLVLPDRERQPWRQPLGRALHIVVNSASDLERALVPRPKDRDEHGRIAIEPRSIAAAVAWASGSDGGGTRRPEKNRRTPVQIGVPPDSFVGCQMRSAAVTARAR